MTIITKQRIVRGLAATFTALTLSACSDGIPDLRTGDFNLDRVPTSPASSTDQFGQASSAPAAINTDAAVNDALRNSSIHAAVTEALNTPNVDIPDVRKNPTLQATRVDYHGSAPINSILIDTDNLKLYFIDRKGSAMQYPVALGKLGAEMPDVAYFIDRTAKWPKWWPTENMRENNPDLPKVMDGGLGNPLGAAALYLSNANGFTIFRIHGNNDPSSIGKNASAGCVRMYNDEVSGLEIQIAGLLDQGIRIAVELAEEHEIQVSYQGQKLANETFTPINPFQSKL
jgi:lipoprotein-anchoring transpeptidase ErfK/SrfK